MTWGSIYSYNLILKIHVPNINFWGNFDINLNFNLNFEEYPKKYLILLTFSVEMGSSVECIYILVRCNVF